MVATPYWGEDVKLCMAAMQRGLTEDNLVIASDLLEIFPANRPSQVAGIGVSLW